MAEEYLSLFKELRESEDTAASVLGDFFQAWRSPKAIIFDCQKSTISSVNSLAVRSRTASVVCLELGDFCLVKNAKSAAASRFFDDFCRVAATAYRAYG